MEEKVIWKGTPSQWTNFGTFFLCTFFCWLIIPVFIGLWKYLTVKTWKIKITNQRVIEEKGVFSKITNETELFRVKDLQLHQPLALRFVGLSNIVLITSDKTTPTVTIPAIKKGKAIREQLRIAIDERRDLKRVRETDFDY